MLDSEKHWQDWILLKATRHDANQVRTITEGEIWWCAVGENIGIEINGKSVHLLGQS